MEISNQNYVDYIESTKGMRKEDKIQYLINLIEENKNDLCIFFGSYYQRTKNEKGEFIKEPILWKVLNCKTIQNDGYLLLLSKYLLDTYHFSYENNVYKTSAIRKVLNNYFYKEAFTKENQKKIIPTNIDDYTDKVFLLAKEDYKNRSYFTDDNSRKASCTDFAIYTRGYQNKTTQAGTYWTRSIGPSETSKGVAIINHYGSITSWSPWHKCPGWHRGFAPMGYETVRPAIRVKI